MGKSDKIEAFIIELIKNNDDWVEFGRNELAEIFNCVPSQINYVINTRFNPRLGYCVESRRGGGGYLKIKRIEKGGEDILASIPDSIGDKQAKEILEFAKNNNIIKNEYAKLISQALDSIGCLDFYEMDVIRAKMLKNMIMTSCVMQEGE